VRVIDRWNSLDRNAIDSGNVNALQNSLDRIREQQGSASSRTTGSPSLMASSAPIFSVGAVVRFQSDSSLAVTLGVWEGLASHTGHAV